MTLDENITQYLEDNGIGTEGTDLFISDLPGTTTNAVMVKLTGGEEPNKYVDVKRLTVQIMVRNSNPQTAKTTAYSIYDLLHNKDDDFVLETGGVDVMRSEAISFPSMILKDEEGRTYYSTNYLFTVRGTD